MSDPRDHEGWPWPRSLDAAIAAPDSHQILLENERVRVVRVYIPPGAREPSSSRSGVTGSASTGTPSGDPPGGFSPGNPTQGETPSAVAESGIVLQHPPETA